MTRETQKYIIRERVALSKLHQDALCRIERNTPARAVKQPKINARTFRVLQRAGLVQFTIERGPKGGRIVIDHLTAKGKQIVDRIHDECEGVDLSTGEYLFLVETLPAGMTDGQQVDENGKAIVDEAKRERMMQNAKAALDRVADSMQRNSVELGATLDKLAQRNAQLDAQERDTLQSTASAKIERQIRAERGEQLTKEERDAEISELLDEERTLRTLVQERSKLTTAHRQKAFRNGRIHRSALRAYYASTDLLVIEVMKLDAVRAQLALLTPQGMYATRTSDERIEFVRL